MNKISNGMPILSMTESVLAKGSRGYCHEESHCHEECSDHGDCQGIQPVVQRTVKCFNELRRLAYEVFERLEREPNEKRLLTIYTCFILEDINSVFKEVAALKNQICCKGHREADFIIPNENFSPNVTSGIVFVTNGHTEKVRVAVLNNTAVSQTIRVRILNSSVSPYVVLNDMLLEVNSCCSSLISQLLGSASSYEIQVFNLVPGMTVSSVEEANSGSFIDGTKLTATAFIPNLGVCP